MRPSSRRPPCSPVAAARWRAARSEERASSQRAPWRVPPRPAHHMAPAGTAELAPRTRSALSRVLCPVRGRLRLSGLYAHLSTVGDGIRWIQYERVVRVDAGEHLHLGAEVAPFGDVAQPHSLSV